MSQSGDYERSGGSSGTDIKTLTGNTGNTVRPDSSGDAKIVGTGNVTVTGSSSTHTLTISSSAAKDATTTEKGIVELSTPTETVTGTDATKAVTSVGVKAKLGDQTNHAVPVAQGSDKKFEYKNLTDGQLLIGASGKDPKGANLASSDSTIVFTTGENALDLKTGSRVPTSVGVDGGDSAIPSGSQFKIKGGSNVSTSASGDTITIDATSPHAQDATTTRKGVSRLSTDNESQVGTATGAITVTPTSLKYKLGDQTTHGIAYGKGTGEKIQWTTGLTDGQIVIGDTDGTPQAANVTSSNSTLVITNGSNSLDLKASPAIPTKVVTESGTVTPRNNQLTITGGKGLNTNALGENVIVRIGSSVPDKFVGDAGSGAVPVGSVLNVKGGTNCNTVATGDTVTVNVTGGGGGGGGDLTFDTDGTPAKSDSDVIKMKGGNLVTTSGSGNEVTFALPDSVVDTVVTEEGNVVIDGNELQIAGSDAMIDTKVDPTKTNRLLIAPSKELVSSITTNSGTVSGDDHGISITGGTDCSTKRGSTSKDLVIDVTGGNTNLEFSDTKSPEGIARPSNNKIEMHGDTGIDVSASGDRVRFSAKGNVPTSIEADSGSATPSNNSFELRGGSNVSTSASGNVVTINSTGGGGGSGIKYIDPSSGGDVYPTPGTASDKGSVNMGGFSGIRVYGEPASSSLAIYLASRHTTVTKQDLVTPSANHRESFGTMHLCNTPANEGSAIQLPSNAEVGYEMSFISINSTYPGFEIFPPGGGKIWIGDRSTSAAPASGALGVARVRSTKRGDVLRLICVKAAPNPEWQAYSTIGTFTLM